MTERRRGMRLLWGALLLLALYAAVQGVRCHIARMNRESQLADYDWHTADLSYGAMTYLDKGEGTALLAVHGIFGGYDQGYESVKGFEGSFRILAPSRFGYLGSDILGDGTPAEQARAYSELLDTLGIDKVYVLGTSAGGSAAIRFALDYPERTKGLLLYCSAMPLPSKPESFPEYAGPPAFLCSDYAMFLLSPLFGPIMGMTPDTIHTMLPISERKQGVLLDAAVTNPDMARHFEAYPIERLKCPTLILHARDDKLASYQAVTEVIHRFPNCTFVSFENGGHLMAGHAQEVHNAVADFMEEHNG